MHHNSNLNIRRPVDLRADKGDNTPPSNAMRAHRSHYGQHDEARGNMANPTRTPRQHLRHYEALEQIPSCMSVCACLPGESACAHMPRAMQLSEHAPARACTPNCRPSSDRSRRRPACTHTSGAAAFVRTHARACPEATPARRPATRPPISRSHVESHMYQENSTKTVVVQHKRTAPVAPGRLLMPCHATHTIALPRFFHSKHQGAASAVPLQYRRCTGAVPLQDDGGTRAMLNL